MSKTGAGKLGKRVEIIDSVDCVGHRLNPSWRAFAPRNRLTTAELAWREYPRISSPGCGIFESEFGSWSIYGLARTTPLVPGVPKRVTR